MRELCVGNGKIITRNPKNPFVQDGCIYAKNGIIEEIGSTAALLAQHPDAQWVDAQGGVIMPGLINTHHHIYSAFARGLSMPHYAPRNFTDILQGMWWKLDEKLTPDQVRASALATYLDCIKNGVTTVFDHHASYGAISGSLFDLADAATQLGVRACLCFEVSDRHGALPMREAVLENASFLLACEEDDTGLLKGMFGMHAPFTLSDTTLAYCAQHKPEGIGIHIHVAEDLADVHDSLKKYGKRPIERLFEFDLLDENAIAVHCVHITPEEMDLLAQTNTMAVHNPESNMGNAVGCGAVLEMLRRGICVGLGTDGYTSDMLESYKVANLLQKHNLSDPSAAWAEIPHMLFDHNAQIAQRVFGQKIGTLQTGAVADIIITDYDPLTPLHAANVNGHILFGMSGRSVVTTIIDGEVLMQDREIFVADEAAIMEECRDQAAQLWEEMQ